MSGKRICIKLTKEFDLPEVLVRKLLMETLTEIEAIVAETGRCQIRGFGTFKLKTFAARRARDFVTSKIIDLPQRRKLVFEHSRERVPLFLLKSEEVKS